jgi:hypothetical protein
MVIDMKKERLDRIDQLARFLELKTVLSLRDFGGEAERQNHVKRSVRQR